ncbi:S1C family serine protease [Deinococcus sp.]|uniref:S1C family serine protease n=1 Tax=Deinococcus sp. TaxID=47478 RepID=UPI003CC564DC
MTPDLTPAQSAPPHNDFARLSTALADTAASASARVVTVLAHRPISGTVTGQGQVLTIAHALHGDEVQVRTDDDRLLSASVAGRDPVSDLALLSVPDLGGSAPEAAPTPRTAELLLALGRPGQLQASLGMFGQVAPVSGWLASGAAPFRGVSGGALLDAQGRLLGILNAGMVRGQLLALPLAAAVKVAGILAERGRVPQGYLGVGTQPVRFPSAEAGSGRGRGRLGLTVVRIEEGSPAQAAGLKVGDVLLALNGEALKHPAALHEEIRRRAGEQADLNVLRGGEELTLAVMLGER